MEMEDGLYSYFSPRLDKVKKGTCIIASVLCHENKRGPGRTISRNNMFLIV